MAVQATSTPTQKTPHTSPVPEIGLLAEILEKFRQRTEFARHGPHLLENPGKVNKEIITLGCLKSKCLPCGAQYDVLSMR